MPELVVSIIAGIEGNTEIAIGNVLGSNIANVFLILGITAIISPMILTKSIRLFDIPVVIVSSLIFLVLVSDIILEGSPINIIGRTDGVFLLFLALIYIGYTVRHNNHLPEEAGIEEVNMNPWKASFLITGGVSLLLVGGKSLVTGAVDLATML